MENAHDQQSHGFDVTIPLGYLAIMLFCVAFWAGVLWLVLR